MVRILILCVFHILLSTFTYAQVESAEDSAPDRYQWIKNHDDNMKKFVDKLKATIGTIIVIDKKHVVQDSPEGDGSTPN